ncbi:biotin/lipoate--protein ligase family protein [Falsiroseomonas ponticola]|uniref:biotin/lipoate--protein ligase family protein n=1 Tax=Falsiroseomonas ponticola TaxID=2786951 RepID=UPI00299EF6F2|nr:biotin/lipoate--protein ligase family protein [Roseomonas ponticola]
MASELPELPSVFDPVVALREGGDAMARAVALAPRHGAGTLAWVRSASRIEAAVVLEPEMPLAAARGAIFAGASALGDALAAYGPPEVPLTFHWPGIVLVNEGQVGRIRLAWPEGAAEAREPAWLVLGMEARLSFPRGWEPGHGLQQTAVFEEGWSEEEVSAAQLTAAWARHLMANLAEWQRTGPGSGFSRMAERYLARLARQAWMGEARRGIDPATGDLVLEDEGTRSRYPLADALAVTA